ncbi:MAG: DUF3579 domain-containing protein [Pseudomonadota bacterium]
MQQSDKQCWLIRSVKQDGERFRPSDWAERISAGVARFSADRRLRYDAQVRPRLKNGEKCLYVDGGLAKRDPALFDYIKAFVAGNALRVEKAECA